MEMKLSKFSRINTFLLLIIFGGYMCTPKGEIQEIRKIRDIEFSKTSRCEPIYDTILNKNVYVFTDKMPSFIDNNTYYEEYIMQYFKGSAVTDSKQFSFVFEFVVDCDGSIVGERIINKEKRKLTNAELDLLRIVKSMKGWIPGECEGIKVPVKITGRVNVSYFDS